MLTYSASLVAASVKILPESATPDVQISFAPGSFKDGQIGALEEEPGLTGGPWQMRPLSRGYVEERSPRPEDPPLINPRYLTREAERRRVALRAPDLQRAILAAVYRRRKAAGRLGPDR